VLWAGSLEHLFICSPMASSRCLVNSFIYLLLERYDSSPAFGTYETYYNTDACEWPLEVMCQLRCIDHQIQ
jgi:hypothetical protein